MKPVLVGLVALALAGCSKQEPAVAAKLEMIAAPPGVDVAAHVGAAVAAARSSGKQVVVYVGATWCEPCRYFHEAAASGQLDAEFGNLRLVEFDLDRDGAALDRAGYRSEMIPLFALPQDDGRASGKAIQGSIKGDAAVGNIVPRLHALLAPR